VLQFQLKPRIALERKAITCKVLMKTIPDCLSYSENVYFCQMFVFCFTVMLLRFVEILCVKIMGGVKNIKSFNRKKLGWKQEGGVM